MGKSKPRRADGDREVGVSQKVTPGLLEQRPLSAPDKPPTVQIKASAHRPFLFRKMIGEAQLSAKPGDLVQVVDRDGQPAGFGLYNPRSEIVVRMLDSGVEVPDEAFWRQRIERAASLRRDVLKLDAETNAYRLVHAEGDGLTGLIVDRFDDVLSAEVFSLGVYQRIDALMAELLAASGARHWVARVDAQVHGQEGFVVGPRATPECPSRNVVVEHGVKHHVRFLEGHKTGFFCDQRDNRKRLAAWCAGRNVLDLCCYTGGFSLAAKMLGQANEVIGVDLDETAVAQAQENAKLNRANVRFVHSDAFAYMRDLLRVGRRFDVVVLDPPKLIRNRREIEDGRRKYMDMNRLAMQLVEPGGLLLTCSCSGLMSRDEFLALLQTASRQSPASPVDGSPLPTRRFQLLDLTGPGGDHPTALDALESSYLKAVWLRAM